MIGSAVLGALAAGAGGLLMPLVVRRVPEPAQDPAPLEDPTPLEVAATVEDTRPTEVLATADEAAPVAEAAPKALYVDIAAGRGIRVGVPVASVAAGALVGAVLGWDWSLLLWLPLTPVLIALAVVDWRTRLLPTWVIRRTYWVLGVLAVAAGVLSGDLDALLRAGLGGLVALACFFVLWFIHPRGLGFGDVRLSGVLGIALGYLGWGELVAGLYSAFLVGGIGGALLALLRLADRKGVPFGPFLVIGAFLGVLVGPWTWSHLAGGGA
ncbi:prepilin peptidase [Nocardioides houyundeii]|uniref:prepilin peptidase n=1 Tax=Nocardioides houyundeii TaxID=2045452 RepID=UPI000DF10E3D|nr:A24 family peptidase [Nocardioides houyundeii]